MENGQVRPHAALTAAFFLKADEQSHLALSSEANVRRSHTESIAKANLTLVAQRDVQLSISQTTDGRQRIEFLRLLQCEAGQINRIANRSIRRLLAYCKLLNLILKYPAPQAS